MTRREALKAAGGGIGGLVLSIENASAEAEQEAAIKPEPTWRVLEGPTGKEVRWRDLPGKLATANAIFLGEQHDDPQTHKAEAALLQAVHEKVGERLTFALEMFERDGQTVLNDYLSGKNDEAALAKSVRLWPNYTTDYRPLIEYAKSRKIPVLGSNAPGRIVRKVGQEGIKFLESLPSEDRPYIASYTNAPAGDEYATRFFAIIGQGHGSGPMPLETKRRFYEAQCLRDDTMAETITRALDAGRTVLHVNGSFHSDAGLGTAARVLWRRPLGTRLAIVKIVPYKDKIVWEPLKGEADFFVFVPDTRTAKPNA